jgi:hypothetical protein
MKMGVFGGIGDAALAICTRSPWGRAEWKRLRGLVGSTAHA